MICKKFVPRSGPTEHWTRFGSITDSIRDPEFSNEEKVVGHTLLSAGTISRFANSLYPDQTLVSRGVSRVCNKIASHMAITTGIITTAILFS